MGKKVAVLVRDHDRQYEGLRTSLGLLLENHLVSMFVMDHEIEISEDYLGNMEYIDIMGGARYSNVGANVDKHAFRPASWRETADKLPLFDVVIPF